MKNIREMFNISYFDNKELSLKEHCDIYSNIKKELVSILNKYDIKYVLAETEVIKDLSKENQELKKQLEEKQNPLKGIFAQVNDDTLLRDCGNMNAEINELKNQQKEFIEYMNKTIEELECDDVDDKEMKGYLIQRIDIFKEILSKYKEIIGNIFDEKE